MEGSRGFERLKTLMEMNKMKWDHIYKLVSFQPVGCSTDCSTVRGTQCRPWNWSWFTTSEPPPLLAVPRTIPRSVECYMGRGSGRGIHCFSKLVPVVSFDLQSLWNLLNTCLSLRY